MIDIQITQHHDVTLSDEEAESIAIRVLLKLNGFQSGYVYFVKNKQLYKRGEEVYGGHSKIETTEIRTATAFDLSICTVLKKLM